MRSGEDAVAEERASNDDRCVTAEGMEAGNEFEGVKIVSCALIDGPRI